jgi:hypothetical protein
MGTARDRAPHWTHPRGLALAHSNYGYVCKACDLAVRLADLLPRFEDL